MGSRTGSTFKSLAGRKRGSKLKSVGASISVGMQAGETAVVSSGGAVSAGSGAIASGGGGGAGVAFVAPIAGAAALVASSKPSMDVVYHTTKLADSVFKNLGDLTSKYQTVSQNQAVYSYFAKSPVEFPVNMVQSMVVDEVSDLAWANVKSELGLKTTAHQDRIAKFVISQLIGLTLNMIKQKIKGEKIDKHFFYKEAMGAAIEYCLDGFMQSNAENEVLSSNPSITYCQMETGSQKVFEVATKEIAKEISELIYDDISSKESFPEQKQFNKILKKRVTEKLKIEVEASEYERDTDFKKQKIVASGEKEISGSIDKKDVIISTEDTVNKRKVKDAHKVKFHASGNDYVTKHITLEHRDLLFIATTLSRIEFLMRTEKGDVDSILPRELVIYSRTDISKKIEQLVNGLASFLLTYNPHISIVQNVATSEKQEKAKGDEKADVIVLFSGGLDSLAGYEYIKRRYKNPKFVYVNNNVSKTRKFVKHLQKKLGLGNDLITFQSQTGGGFLQQTRGFLFLSAAAVTADIYGAKEIIVAECGVTKYQPSTTIADEITKTTHKFMVNISQEIFSSLGIDVKITFPFDKNTKAEIIANCTNRETLVDSRSCRSTRYSDEKKAECGYCFACLLKNISLSYVMGKKQEQFIIDPITNPSSHTTPNIGQTWSLTNKRYESVFSLINFSKSMLADSLPEPIQKYLDDYGTTKLFINHAEDMIYGLMFMKNKGWVKNEKVLELLGKIEKESWFDKRRILERRKELLNIKT